MKTITIHLGVLSGVYNFFKNDMSVLVIHFYEGYRILRVSTIKQCSLISFEIKNKNTKTSETFNSFDSLIDCIEKRKYNDFKNSRKITLTLHFSSSILENIDKREFTRKGDIDVMSNVIQTIDATFGCLGNEDIRELLEKFNL